jgi:hypothetical protein
MRNVCIPLRELVNMRHSISKLIFSLVLMLFALPMLAVSYSTTTSLVMVPSDQMSVGTPLTLTATVISKSAGPGFVMFCDTAKGSCDTSLVFGSERSNVAVLGTVSAVRISPTQLLATLKVHVGAGTHKIKAVFLSTAVNLQSESTPQELTAIPAPIYASTTSISASGSPGNYLVSGSVTAFGNLPLTGSVNVEDVPTGFIQASIALKPSAWSFTVPLLLSQEAFPLVLGAGDFNGDGIPDVVTASTTYIGSISIFIGKGDGTFKQPILYAVDANPYSMAVGDFDEDGNLDLIAVGGAASGAISVFVGNGDGTFRLKAHYTTPWTLTAVVVSDYNGDGHADIAITGVPTGAQGKVSIYLGNGDGTFQKRSDYGTQQTPSAIAIGDLNRDGKSDLVVAHNFASQLSIYLGNGDGTLQPPVDYQTSSNSYTNTIEIADFNADGALDLVTAFDSSHLAIFFGDGDGNFSRKTLYLAGGLVLGVAVNDFNADGAPDIAMVQGGNGRFGIMYGNYDGTFQAYKALTNTSNSGRFFPADFNGDGTPDLLASSYNPYLVLGQVTASFDMSAIELLGEGSHQIAGVHVDDALRTPNQSNVITLTGRLANTLSTLRSAQNPTSFGTPIHITASFSANRGVNPSGTAILMEGKQVVGSAVVENGSANFDVSGLSTGAHTLYVSYPGDSNYHNSSSPNLVQVVDRDAAVFAIRSSKNPAPFGMPFTLVATTSNAATGTVTFTEGQTVLGTGSLNGGVVKITVSNLVAGSHTISVVYSGDQNYK